MGGIIDANELEGWRRREENRRYEDETAELKRENVKLTAQVDRQAKVVDAARELMQADSSYAVGLANTAIYNALREYDEAMAQLAGEGR